MLYSAVQYSGVFLFRLKLGVEISTEVWAAKADATFSNLYSYIHKVLVNARVSIDGQVVLCIVTWC